MQKRNHQDSAWKEILDAYLSDFMNYCLPQISLLIDWSQGWIPLDKELHSIFKNIKKNKGIVDKLFKVFLKNGEERLILLHVEVQGKKEIEFPKRILVYACLIYQKHRCPLISCIILTDNQKDWRPDHFQVGAGGFGLSAKFAVIKILDYQTKQEELDASSNPFASVILAQLHALKSDRKPHDQRKHVKLELTKRLFRKGFSKQDIQNLYSFIDWLIGLPENFEIEYLDEIHKLEEINNMPYVTSAERIGMKRGREQGWQEGTGQVAKELLANNMEISFVKKVTGLPLEKIKALQKELIEALAD